MTENLILSLETSSSVCGVALSSHGELIAQSELRIDKSHASHLLPQAESLLRLAGFRLADVAAVALSAGPGSYTGLRIGAASAKGLCMALRVPLLAVSSLQALAREAIVATIDPAATLFVPMIDARRQEVFAGLFDDRLTELQPEAPHILTPESWADQLVAGPVVFCGSGAAKFRELRGYHPHAHFLPHLTPSAGAVAWLAGEKFARGLFEDVAYFEPIYLKEAYTTTPRRAVL